MVRAVTAARSGTFLRVESNATCFRQHEYADLEGPTLALRSNAHKTYNHAACRQTSHLQADAAGASQQAALPLPLHRRRAAATCPRCPAAPTPPAIPRRQRCCLSHTGTRRCWRRRTPHQSSSMRSAQAGCGAGVKWQAVPLTLPSQPHQGVATAAAMADWRVGMWAEAGTPRELPIGFHHWEVQQGEAGA